MRTIKFRVWSNKEKKFIKTENKESEMLLRRDGTLGCVSHEDNMFHRYKKGMYEVNQCIGLKDKNGKDIYEGDILKEFHFRGCNDKFKIYALSNNLQLSYGYCPDIYGWEVGCYVDENEIIGNIYENPELIK